MFELSIAWWQLPLRAALVYLLLLVMVRFSGKRTIGQFTPFDLLVMLLLSESVSNGLSGGDESVLGGLLSAGTLVLLNAAIAYASSRNRKLESILEGSAVLIARDGRLLEEPLQRYRVGQADVEKALREADCTAAELDRAYLESDGNISVLKKRR
jgi:uncharacterized membrane protein YcaP (DUF421 family)